MRKNQSRILITGGAGFIGSNLVKKLYNLNNKITIFDINTVHPFLKNMKINRIKGDVRDYDSVQKAANGQDYVYHLASCNSGAYSEKEKIFSVNIAGTENVMDACLSSGVKKVVHVSSGSVLGFSKYENRRLTENSLFDFKDQLYAQSKKYGEDVVMEYVKKGLNATIVVPAYVVGAGEVNPARAGVFKSIAHNRIKFTYPGGTGTVAVEDIVRGLILAMEKGKPGDKYNISNENGTLFEIYNMIADIMDKKKIVFRLPSLSYYPLYILGAILEKTIKEPLINTETIRWTYNFRYYDSTKARKELGWKPKVPLKESLKRTIKYYKDMGII